MRLAVRYVGIALALSSTAHAADTEIVTDSTPSMRFHFSDHALFAAASDPFEKTSPPKSSLRHESRAEAGYGLWESITTFTNDVGFSEWNKEVRQFRLEKKRVTFRSDDWEVHLGDSYQEVGRGLALSLYRDPVFGLDTTLEGGSVRYRSNVWEAGFFAGRVNTLRIPVAVNPVTNPLRDRDVWLGSAQLAARTSAGKFGAHYVGTTSRPAGSSTFDRRWETVGTSYEGTPFENVETYVESNALFTDLLQSSGRVKNGHATYGAVTWAPLPWKAKLEAKDYRAFYYDFRRAPTLEDDAVVSLNTQDVTAGKMTLEKRVLDGRSSIYASYLLGADRLTQGNIHHGVAGSKWKLGKREEIEVRGGYRLELGAGELVHGLVRAKVGTVRGQSMEVGFRKQRWFRRLGRGVSSFDDRNFADLAYNFSERWNMAAGYEYVPSNPVEEGSHFANAGVTYKDGSFSGRAFVGQTSGGTQCSGGVCRQVPPFTGAYLDTTFTL